MAQEDRTRWDAIYKARALEPYPAPDALLLAYAPPVPAAGGPRRALRALDVAAGLCQNAVWLARQGYLVDAVDISRVGLLRGQAEMAMYNLRTMNLFPLDLDAPALPVFAEAAYDVVCVFRYLNRDRFPALRRAVKPGGLIIYEAFNTRRLLREPDFNRAYLLALQELPGYFPGWAVLHDEDRGDRSRFVGRKPAPQPEQHQSQEGTHA